MKMRKILRLMPIMMAVMMAFAIMSALSQTAYAESYNLWVGNDEVTTEKASGTGWSYNANSNTLTLDGANITGGYNYAGIYYGGTTALNIVLKGSNSIALTGTDKYGIYSSNGDITISGDGSLSTAACYEGICASQGHDITINGGTVDGDPVHAGQDVIINDGSVTASGSTAIQAERNVTISGGTVTATATGDNGNAISASYYIDLMGGSVTASGTGTGQGIYATGIDEIGKYVRIWAGADESSATDVTDIFRTDFNSYKWVQTETATLWVGGIPVISRNAENILGDAGVSASYDYDKKTLTLNNYSYESDGYRCVNDPGLPGQYAAIYADQDLNILFNGKNTVKCTEKEGSEGLGIYSYNKALTISGSGTLDATGYGDSGVGIYARNGDIEFNGGTVNALCDTVIGISTDKKDGYVRINSGIVTASGSDRGFSGSHITASDDLGINAGDSKETATGVDKGDFESDHLQHWVQVAKAYPLWVCGIWVMVTNKDDVLGDGKVSYDPETNTLKLNGADIRADSKHQYNNAAIYYGDDKNELIINAVKASTVTGPESTDVSANGISSEGPLNVKGSLTAIGRTGAIVGIVKNAVPGLGWTNTKGTEGKTVIKVNTRGQNLGNTIKKAVFPASSATVTKAPAARSLTYNGSAQALVTAGTAKNGTMHYAIGKDNKTVPTTGWSKAIPKATKSGTYYVWYKAAGDEIHKDSEHGCVVCTIKSKPKPAPKPAPAKVSGTPLAKAAVKKNSMTIAWNRIQGAAGYDIFFSRCDHHGKRIVCKRLKTIKGNKTFKWKKSGLKKGTPYKFYVRAYVYKNGKKTYVSKSPIYHAYTGNGTKKYTNAKSVTIKNVKKGKLSLKKGKTFKIKAKVNKVSRKKKLMPKSHAPTLRYMTSNKKVATVNSSGKISAKGKGTCYIYVYAHNGVSKQIKMTVK